ncbi:BAG family molecular chaperone regulator 3 [Mercurialis annua]|uniref:BAG family molecular chaperone regulator 3 n=1 Tax=Mercurialis annua TaxID=3986 RepID=UPI00215E5EDD|nr:BAG family molecular chaperone regulator 3 [Mercurialis annua]
MMRMKTKPTGLSHMNGGGGVRGGESGSEWELRPGGMLVQKRNPGSDRSSIPPPTIRLRVKYGSTYHELSISSQATFGELKKLLAGPTGLHHEDQKLMFKDKERDSKAFLDICGVKDKSKIVVVEDPISQEKRFLEMRRNAKMEKASKSISEISLEVDRLAGQVSALESIISKGGNIPEKTLLNLIELLMNQLLKLDGIMGDGDVKLQRKMQVRRVQKYVETLDMLKSKNSTPNGSNGNHKPTHSNGQRLAPIQEHQPRPSNGHNLIPIDEEEPPRRSDIGHSSIQQQQSSRRSTSEEVVFTTQWETFDSTPPLLSSSSASNSAPNNSNNNSVHQPKFPWDFFG